MAHFIPLFLWFLLNFALINANNSTYNRSKRHAESLQPYNYRPYGRFGQGNWGNYYPKCSLKRQSPIDINMNRIQYGDFPSTLRTTNIDTKPLEIEIRNNGYTALVSYYWACCAPKIYGGPLMDVHEFLGLHFHWGKDDYHGTEHSIDGKHEALEAHMIFKNVKYETKEEALYHDDGLCVFALRFKCDDNAPPFDLLEGISQIPNWGDTVKTFYPNTFAMTDLIVYPDFHYAYYQGSLTNPPCYESVQWIVNLKTMPMNCTQLKYFRAMKDKANIEISGNCREVQELNGRTVYHS